MTRKATWLTGFAVLTAALAVGITSALFLVASFGGRATGARAERLRASPAYRDGAFVNVVPPAPRSSGVMVDYLRRQFGGDEVRRPPAPLPVTMLPPSHFAAPPRPGLRAVWLGHAGVYLEIDGARVLVDPILSDYASPIARFGPGASIPRRSRSPTCRDRCGADLARPLRPPGHGDGASTGATGRALLRAARHRRASRALGRAGGADHRARLVAVGDDRAACTITCTPSRHYSGRGLRDGNATLWSSWAIAGAARRVFYSGDTGFGRHFATIGERLGPFDLSLIKVGAYGPGQTWRDIHMDPEEAVAARAR